MAKLNNIVYLSEEDYDTLVEEGSITKGDVTVTYNPDDVYMIPSEQGGGTWGSIEGTLSDQTDLQSALDAKADTADIPDVSGLASKVELSTGLATKADDSAVVKKPTATSTFNRVVHVASGSLTPEYQFSANTAAGNTYAIRTANGRLKAVNPTEDDDLTTKSYVDTAVAAKADKSYVDTADASLQDQIDNLTTRGKYLSTWDAEMGLPETEPTTPLPYTYTAGDYFIVGKVATGSLPNYKPDGSSYTGDASDVEEEDEIKVNDTYIYDGDEWKLLSTPVKDVTWGSIQGSISSQTDLQSALDTIPTAVSELTNDSGFVTSSYHDNSKQDLSTAYNKSNVVYSETAPSTPVEDMLWLKPASEEQAVEWGDIEGTLSDQSDLATALNGKQDNLPTVTNNYYLHANASNGALEWSPVSVPNIVYSSTEPSNPTVGMIWLQPVE